MSLATATLNQYDTLRALVLRETRIQHAGSRLGYLLAVVEPTLWVMMFYAAFVYGGRARPTHGMDILPFLATGVCTFKAFQKVGGSVGPKVPKALVTLPRVTSLDLVASKALLAAATMSLVFLILVGGAGLVSGSLGPVDDPLLVVWGMFLACTLGFGFGLLLGCLARYTAIATQIKTVVSRVMFWTSGLFFVVEDLPSSAREIVLYNPALHAVEFVRGGWFPSYRAIYADSEYALGCALVMLLVGLSLERTSRDRSL